MNALIVIAGVFIFVSGIVLGRQSQSPDSKILNFTKSFQEATPTISPTPEPTTDPTETPQPSTSSQPTTKPSSTPKPNPTNKPVTSNTNLSDFKYPGSSVSSESSNKLVLTSSDSPSSITSWYENKLKASGYSSRASAKTNTNGNVTNKLGGGKDGSSVNIEIQKKANEGSTTITITTGTDSSSDVHIKIENNEPYL